MAKHKIEIDPDADGNQWIYRGWFVVANMHPQLQKYCVYTDLMDFVDTCDTLKAARTIIDDEMRESQAQ